MLLFIVSTPGGSDAEEEAVAPERELARLSKRSPLLLVRYIIPVCAFFLHSAWITETKKTTRLFLFPCLYAVDFNEVSAFLFDFFILRIDCAAFSRSFGRQRSGRENWGWPHVTFQLHHKLDGNILL